MAGEALTLGSTRRFRLEARKDGAVWDLTGAAVTLTFTRPDGTQLVAPAVVADGPAGKAEYVTAVSDLDQMGVWLFSWKVVVGGITAPYGPEAFAVIKP